MRDSRSPTRQAGPGAELDDLALRRVVQRAVQADPDAWERLYRRSYSRLFAYARRRVPTDAAADDAVAETMLRALARIATFTWQGAGFDAWLYGILRNVVLESLRQNGRATSEVLVPDHEEHDTTTMLEALVQRDRHDEVRTAFAQLSSDDQEILEMRVVAGLSAAGVAEATGSTAGAVRMAQSRALQRLRVHYEAVQHDN